MPGVGHLQLRKLADVRVDRRGEGPQRRRPLGGGQSRPVPLCGLGAGNRIVDRRLIGLLDRAQHLFGGGVDQFAHAHAFTFPVAYTAAACTTAANSRRSSSLSSGCHCTAKTKLSPGISTASMTPSESWADTIRPSPSLSIAWW